MIKPITRIDLEYYPSAESPYRVIFWREGIPARYYRTSFELVMRLIQALPQSGYLVPCANGWWWAPNRANPTAFGVSANLLAAARQVIDTYAADYDVQEVGGDPLERAITALSEAL